MGRILGEEMVGELERKLLKKRLRVNQIQETRTKKGMWQMKK